jgi:TP901 family phage tail tape measure protein
MNPIGFKELFNDDLNAGLIQIKATIEEINKALAGTKSEADKFAQAVGSDLKGKIDAITSSSSNLDGELKKVKTDFETFKNATAQTKATIDAYKKTTEDLTQKTKKLEEELKKAKTGVEGVGKAKKSASIDAKQLAQSLIGVGTQTALVYKGIQILGQQLVEAFKSTMTFEKAIKEVGAISRASSENLELLTASANRLGATTEKTAVEIAKLQKELAKLGFTSAEILASTDAIVDLSTATGEDLAKSATVAASTLRAFGLEATEMKRVVDVMAGSFVRSGLDLEKFRESIKLVAPIARAVNVDIETTTASLSKLADAGLSGSLAGTALRNLLSNMADPTSKLSTFLGYTVKNSQDLIVAFKDLRDRGVGLAEAVQLVDVRARPAFFTLMNQIDAVEALSKEYLSLTGESQRLAEQMRDTLSNDVEILNSAFDGLRRNIAETSTNELRELVKGLTDTTEYFRFLVTEIKEGETALAKFVKGWIEYLKFANPYRITGNAIEFIKKDLENLGFEFKSLEEKKYLDNFNNKMKEAESSTKAYAKALEGLQLKSLVDEYIRLNNAQSRTQEQNDRILEIDKELRSSFGQTALAVDKATGQYFLNTEAIYRKIKADVDSAKISGQVLENRLEEINATIELNRQTSKLIIENTNLNRVVQVEAIQTKQTTDLLREKKIIVDALSKSYKMLTDESVNGWSVLTEKGLEAKKAVEDALKDKNKKGGGKEASEKKKRALLEQIKLQEDLQTIVLKGALAEIEAEKAIAEAKGDKVLATNLYIKQLKLQKDLAKVVYDSEIAQLNISEENKKIIADKKVLIEEKYSQSIKKINNDLNLFEVKNNESLSKKIEDIKIKSHLNIKKFSEKFNKEKAEGEKKISDDEAAELKRKEKEKQEIIKASLQEISKLTSLFFDTAQIKRNNELKRIDVWEKERVRLAGDNQEAIEGIEREAEVKRRAIKKKQAQADKAEAIFQIALDTAVGMVKAFSASPLTFGMPFIALIGALGLAKTAMVLARPLPEFAKGTDNAPEGNAIVGERGRELIWDKKSNTMRVSPDKASMTYLSKGSIVIPHKETEKILSGQVDPNSVVAEKLGSSTKKDNFSFDYNRLGDSFEKAVTKIPIHQTTFDSNGVREFVKKGNSRTERLNRRYKY